MLNSILIICIILLPAAHLLNCPEGWNDSTILNKCYLIVTAKKIWFEAEDFCQKQAPNAHLTSINSAFENSNINAIVIDTQSTTTCVQFWIGANDFNQTGRFVWTDGSPFIYQKWDKSQPDLDYMCVSSLARTTGAWRTQRCGEENCFICDYSKTASTLPPSTSTLALSTSTRPQSASTSSSSASMTDCYDWLQAGSRTSGIYAITIHGHAPFDVYCDMTTDGGGWTVFQKRQDNSVSFYDRTWTEYKNGFNNGIGSNSWLGLDKIHLISTKDDTVVLRVDLYGNQCLNPNYCPSDSFNANDYWYGVWGGFKVDNETRNYRLNMTRATGGNLTSLDGNDLFYGWSNYQAFSTIDRDNNGFGGGNCASYGGTYFGAWWYPRSNCGKYYLNGKYISSPKWGPNGMGVYRTHFVNDYWINPVRSEMKLRRKV